MKRKEVYMWAVKGLSAEIDKLENDVMTGKRYLLEYEKGIQPKTAKTPEEIKEIIKAKRQEVERLVKIRFELEWAISVD